MEKEDIPVYQLIIYDSVFVLTFLTGLYFQIRVIKRSNQEKAVAWKTQICHSLTMIIHFTLIIFSESLFYIFPNIVIDYSGWWWISEIFQYMRVLGRITIFWYSLSVAIQKYIVIVHCVANNSDRRKIEKASLWIFLIVEILWAAGMHIRESNFRSIESNVSLDNCYSRKRLLSFSTFSSCNYYINVLCTFNDNSDYLAHGYFLYFTTEMYCVMQTTISVVINLNIIEALIYLKIFHFSRR